MNNYDLTNSIFGFNHYDYNRQVEAQNTKASHHNTHRQRAQPESGAHADHRYDHQASHGRSDKAPMQRYYPQDAIARQRLQRQQSFDEHPHSNRGGSHYYVDPATSDNGAEHSLFQVSELDRNSRALVPTTKRLDKQHINPERNLVRIDEDRYSMSSQRTLSLDLRDHNKALVQHKRSSDKYTMENAMLRTLDQFDPDKLSNKPALIKMNQNIQLAKDRINQMLGRHTGPLWTESEAKELQHWEEGALGGEQRKLAVKLINDAKRSGKSQLKLKDLGLQVLPSLIFTLKIKELDISNNDLYQLPPEIGKTKGLTKIKAANNKLCRIPEEIGKLVGLQHLDLSNNLLIFNSLPPSLSKLTYLKHLNLSNNEIRDMPEYILSMKKLKELLMSDNQLTEAPSFLNRLDTLRQLDLSHNHINNVSPHWNLLLRKLENLNLANNQIEQLYFPVQSESTALNLKKLNISNNPLNDLPRELGPMKWAEKGQLKTTWRLRDNMRLNVNGTNIIESLLDQGRLELKEKGLRNVAFGQGHKAFDEESLSSLGSYGDWRGRDYLFDDDISQSEAENEPENRSQHSYQTKRSSGKQSQAYTSNSRSYYSQPSHFSARNHGPESSSVTGDRESDMPELEEVSDND